MERNALPEADKKQTSGKTTAYEVITKLSVTDLLTQKSRWQLAKALWDGLNRANDAGKRKK